MDREKGKDRNFRFAPISKCGIILMVYASILSIILSLCFKQGRFRYFPPQKIVCTHFLKLVA